MPGDAAVFSKRAPKHRRNQKPQSLNIWRQIFQKRRKQKKTLRNGHNSGRKRDNFELRKKIVPSIASPKTFQSGRVPPTPTTCHSPMTDISVIWPLRGSFWWRIYPSCGTQRVKHRRMQRYGVATPPPPFTTPYAEPRCKTFYFLWTAGCLSIQLLLINFSDLRQHPWGYFSHLRS